MLNAAAQKGTKAVKSPERSSKYKATTITAYFSQQSLASGSTSTIETSSSSSTTIKSHLHSMTNVFECKDHSFKFSMNPKQRPPSTTKKSSLAKELPGVSKRMKLDPLGVESEAQTLKSPVSRRHLTDISKSKHERQLNDVLKRKYERQHKPSSQMTLSSFGGERKSPEQQKLADPLKLPIMRKEVVPSPKGASIAMGEQRLPTPKGPGGVNGELPTFREQKLPTATSTSAASISQREHVSSKKEHVTSKRDHVSFKRDRMSATAAQPQPISVIHTSPSDKLSRFEYTKSPRRTSFSGNTTLAPSHVSKLVPSPVSSGHSKPKPSTPSSTPKKAKVSSFIPSDLPRKSIEAVRVGPKSKGYYEKSPVGESRLKIPSPTNLNSNRPVLGVSARPMTPDSLPANKSELRPPLKSKEISKKSPVITSTDTRGAIGSKVSSITNAALPTRPLTPVLPSSTNMKSRSPLSLKARGAMPKSPLSSKVAGASSPRSRHTLAVEGGSSDSSSKAVKHFTFPEVTKSVASVMKDSFSSLPACRIPSPVEPVPSPLKPVPITPPSMPDVIELLSDSDSSGGKQVVTGVKRVRASENKPVKRMRLEEGCEHRNKFVTLDSPRKRPLSISSDEECMLNRNSKRPLVVDLTSFPSVIDLTGDNSKLRKKKRRKHFSDQLHNASIPLDPATRVKKAFHDRKRHNSDQWPRTHSLLSDPDLTPELPSLKSKFTLPTSTNSNSCTSPSVRKTLFQSESHLDRTPPLHSISPIDISDDDCPTPVLVKPEILSPKSSRTKIRPETLSFPKSICTETPRPEVSSPTVIRSRPKGDVLLQTSSVKSDAQPKADASPKAIRTSTSPSVVRTDALPKNIKTNTFSPSVEMMDAPARIIRTDASPRTGPPPRAIRTITSPSVVRTDAPQKVIRTSVVRTNASPKAVRTDASPSVIRTDSLPKAIRMNASPSVVKAADTTSDAVRNTQNLEDKAKTPPKVMTTTKKVRTETSSSSSAQVPFSKPPSQKIKLEALTLGTAKAATGSLDVVTSKASSDAIAEASLSKTDAPSLNRVVADFPRPKFSSPKACVSQHATQQVSAVSELTSPVSVRKELPSPVNPSPKSTHAVSRSPRELSPSLKMASTKVTSPKVVITRIPTESPRRLVKRETTSPSIIGTSPKAKSPVTSPPKVTSSVKPILNVAPRTAVTENTKPGVTTSPCTSEVKMDCLPPEVDKTRQNAHQVKAISGECESSKESFKGIEKVAEIAKSPSDDFRLGRVEEDTVSFQCGADEGCEMDIDPKPASPTSERSKSAVKELGSSKNSVQSQTLDLSFMLGNGATSTGWKDTPLHEIHLLMGERKISSLVLAEEVQMLSAAQTCMISNRLDEQSRISSYHFCSLVDHLRLVTSSSRMLPADLLKSLWDYLLKLKARGDFTSQPDLLCLCQQYLKEFLALHPPGQHGLVDAQYSSFLHALGQEGVGAFILWEHLERLIRTFPELGGFLVDLLVADFWAALKMEERSAPPLFVGVFWPGTTGNHVTSPIRTLLENISGLVCSKTSSVEEASQLKDFMSLLFLVCTICTDLTTELILACKRFSSPHHLLCFTSHLYSDSLLSQLLANLPQLKEACCMHVSLVQPETGKLPSFIKPVKLVPTPLPLSEQRLRKQKRSVKSGTSASLSSGKGVSDSSLPSGSSRLESIVPSKSPGSKSTQELPKSESSVSENRPESLSTQEDGNSSHLKSSRSRSESSLSKVSPPKSAKFAPMLNPSGSPSPSERRRKSESMSSPKSAGVGFVRPARGSIRSQSVSSSSREDSSSPRAVMGSKSHSPHSKRKLFPGNIPQPPSRLRAISFDSATRKHLEYDSSSSSVHVAFYGNVKVQPLPPVNPSQSSKAVPHWKVMERQQHEAIHQEKHTHKFNKIVSSVQHNRASSHLKGHGNKLESSSSKRAAELIVHARKSSSDSSSSGRRRISEPWSAPKSNEVGPRRPSSGSIRPQSGSFYGHCRPSSFAKSTPSLVQSKKRPTMLPEEINQHLLKYHKFASSNLQKSQRSAGTQRSLSPPANHTQHH